MPAVTVDVGWATLGVSWQPNRLAANNPLTDAGLAAMAVKFHLMHAARLQHCELLTDAGLGRLAAGCPNLGHLDLSYCKQVTDAGIELLAAGCPNLGHLNLDGCWWVTDAGLERLAADCMVLRHSSVARGSQVWRRLGTVGGAGTPALPLQQSRLNSVS